MNNGRLLMVLERSVNGQVLSERIVLREEAIEQGEIDIKEVLSRLQKAIEEQKDQIRFGH